MDSKTFSFNRAECSTGILHFGVGNFHRAHLQSYTNSLLEQTQSNEWAICGAMIMPQDETLYRRLKSQDGIYSLTVCGRDGNNSVEWIGSLTQLLWSGEGVEPIIDKVASPATRIITLTITEGGYNIDTQAARSDIKREQAPQSVFGIIAEGLRRRIENGAGPITILSCDNLQHNGDTCRRVFTEFFALQDGALAEWVAKNVTFPNSMVDRITPATTPADIERINATLDCRDEAPVYCEDYLQWVVEDNFAAGRPAWERVGVEFTNDVAPFENMKLSLLNASHTLLSYPSLLSGYRKVDEAMHDARIVKFVEDFMNIDVTKYVPAPANTDLELYKKTLIERFANSTVSDQISRLCGDGASKFPVYVMPIVKKMLAGGDDLKRIAYLIAAYRHYLKYQTDDNGVAFDIFEPALQGDEKTKSGTDEPLDFLSISAFDIADIAKSEDFVKLYLDMVASIKSIGAMQTLVTII